MLIRHELTIGDAPVTFYSLLAHLEEAGFPDEVSYHAYHVLDAYIVGFSLWDAGHSLTAAEQAFRYVEQHGEAKADAE